MRKTCPSDFYLIGFPFFENFCIFAHVFDFGATFAAPQLENATSTFTSSDITINVMILRQFGKPNQKDE